MSLRRLKQLALSLLIAASGCSTSGVDSMFEESISAAFLASASSNHYCLEGSWPRSSQSLEEWLSEANKMDRKQSAELSKMFEFYKEATFSVKGWEGLLVQKKSKMNEELLLNIIIREPVCPTKEGEAVKIDFNISGVPATEPIDNKN